MGLRRVVLAVLVACASFGAATAQERPDLERRVQAAVQRLASGDALGAFLELESILTQDDTLWSAYFHRGRAQVQMGDDLGARDSFRRAAELNPGNADLHFLIATAALQLADFDTAWSQAIAAHQAGYDPVTIEAMFKRMEPYAPPPPDLQQRLDAPRVVVVEPDGAGDAMRATALGLRTLLFQEATVALVQDAGRARYRVELAQPQPGKLTLSAIEVGSDRLLGSREVALPDSGPDAATDLAMSAFVTDLARWLAEGP